MRMYLRILLILWIFLVTSACGGNLFANRPGSIPMQPYTNEELGIRGVRPFYCNPMSLDTYDCSSLNSNNSLVIMNQIAYPGTRQDLFNLLLEQNEISDFPPPLGTYQGGSLTWELYEFDIANKIIGPTIFHSRLALAEDQSRIYLVALAALPHDYQLNLALYQSAFEHSLYAFEPIEQDKE